MTVADLILQAVDDLTPTETRIARTLLAEYPLAGTRSGAAVARMAGASPASVQRLATKLGFESLRDFQEALRSEIDGRTRSPFEPGVRDRRDGDDLARLRESELGNLDATLGRLRPETLDSVCCLFLRSSAVWLYGGRFSRSIADYLHAHLRLLRPGTLLLSQSDPPLADELAHARRGVCLAVFDFRRYHVEAEFAARYVKSRRGAVIVFTDPYVSPAARYADHTLIAAIEGPPLADSYAGAVAIADAIVSELLARDDGALDRRVRQVEEARELLAGLRAEVESRT